MLSSFQNSMDHHTHPYRQHTSLLAHIATTPVCSVTSSSVHQHIIIDADPSIYASLPTSPAHRSIGHINSHITTLPVTSPAQQSITSPAHACTANSFRRRRSLPSALDRLHLAAVEVLVNALAFHPWRVSFCKFSFPGKTLTNGHWMKDAHSC